MRNFIVASIFFIGQVLFAETAQSVWEQPLTEPEAKASLQPVVPLCYDGLVPVQNGNQIYCLDQMKNVLYPLYTRLYNRQNWPQYALSRFYAMNNSLCSRNEEGKMNVDLDFKGNVISGYSIKVTGRCLNQFLHGNFRYMVDDVVIMKTKFSNGEEIKTDCVFNRGNRRISQSQCVELYFSTHRK